MANRMSFFNNWTLGSQVTYSDGRYTVSANPGTFILTMKSSVQVLPDDRVSGVAYFEHAGSDPGYLVVLDAQDSTLIQSVLISSGTSEPFNVPISAPVIVGFSLDGNTISSFVDLNAYIDSPVSYNCECDDDYPRKTLPEMRAMMAIRLGYAAQVANGNYPPGVAELIDSFLQEAQELAYRAYKVFRLERFFTWSMHPDIRFYDLLENADTCTKKLDPRMITWVGISQDGNFWRPLICGIRPEYYYSQITGWPQYYEVRQCIEVWPPPSDSTWKLRIKGYFGLMPFETEYDTTTIDYRAVFLLALANAKAHLGQPDAANYASQYREFIANLTAGSHMTRHYIPGDENWVPPPLPILTGYPGDP